MNNKKLSSIKEELFTPLEKSKMSKLFGGLGDSTNKTDPHTITAKNGVAVDDGADPYSD